MVTYSDLFAFVSMICSIVTFRKELVNMVTYSDLFAFVSMICSIVTLVVTLNEHKK